MKRYLYLFVLALLPFLAGAQPGNPDSVKTADQLSAYYNSADNELVIESNYRATHYFQVGVYNITGTPVREIRMECTPSKECKLPLELKPGLYIITVADKGYSITKKIIIQ